ncbi:hypothetical protein Poly24_19260 [Rosistilla carotiformis]|uniref:Uncharacterized protein n=1 Tax=Rosistilla carotiformis TaxID=2528017 RepID=A0A518JRQ7_9BACT|nr:hypothetical protein [Rosistilla carotiformis]QDV68217.1 hypothetical protein Poly24_19260 [Rosistilla carotiformis]
MITVKSRRCNAALAIVVAAWASLASGGEHPDAGPNLSKWTLELRGALKREATTRATAAHSAAVIELCEMCAAMRSDDRYSTSEVLQGLAARARRRLLDVRYDIQVALKRDEIEKPAGFDQQLEKLERLLDERAAAGKDLVPETLSTAAGDSPNEGSSDAPQTRLPGGGFAPGPDNGFLLIELITRTVSPDFWSAQGGPGAVHYYGMHRVMVVRATSRVHEDIQSLLHALGGFPQ